jgi:hypothetical protein
MSSTLLITFAKFCDFTETTERLFEDPTDTIMVPPFFPLYTHIAIHSETLAAWIQRLLFFENSLSCWAGIAASPIERVLIVSCIFTTSGENAPVLKLSAFFLHHFREVSKILLQNNIKFINATQVIPISDGSPFLLSTSMGSEQVWASPAWVHFLVTLTGALNNSLSLVSLGPLPRLVGQTL